VTSLISNEIRRLRFERNEMTQQALADAIGLTRQTVIAIEKKDINRSFSILAEIGLGKRKSQMLSLSYRF